MPSINTLLKFLEFIGILVSLIFLILCLNPTDNSYEPLATLLSFLTTTVLDYLRRSLPNFESQRSTVIAPASTDIKKVVLAEISTCNSTSKSEDTAPHDAIDKILERVLLVYAKHNIRLEQIPNVTPKEHGLTLDVLRDKERALSHITPEYISWLTSTFGVLREWIEIGEDPIYPSYIYYKQEHELLRWLFKRRHLRLRAWAFKHVKVLDKNLSDDESGYIGVQLLFAEPIFEINSKTIYKYHIDSSNWYWNYINTRYPLKSIVRICETWGIYFYGYTIDKDIINSLSQGALFPIDVTRNLRRAEWFIDDYVDSPTESLAAKETDETNDIYEYIETRFRGFLNTLESEEQGVED